MSDCPHDPKHRERPSYGFSRCSRCGEDLTPPSRQREIQHTRNFLRAGDPVRVARSSHEAGFRGRFLYADTDRGGLFYEVAQLDSHGDVEALRSLRPERVTRKAVSQKVA